MLSFSIINLIARKKKKDKVYLSFEKLGIDNVDHEVLAFLLFYLLILG